MFRRISLKILHSRTAQAETLKKCGMNLQFSFYENDVRLYDARLCNVRLCDVRLYDVRLYDVRLYDVRLYDAAYILKYTPLNRNHLL